MSLSVEEFCFPSMEKRAIKHATQTHTKRTLLGVVIETYKHISERSRTIIKHKFSFRKMSAKRNQRKFLRTGSCDMFLVFVILSNIEIFHISLSPLLASCSTCFNSLFRYSAGHLLLLLPHSIPATKRPTSVKNVGRCSEREKN